MESCEKRGSREQSIILRKRHEFESILGELRARVNIIDEQFLVSMSNALELKSCLFSQQISSLVLVIATAVIATRKPELARKQDIFGNSYLRVQELSELIYEYKRGVCLQMVQAEMVGWTSKIWDRLVYSSCYRNCIDLIVLYYFIGDSLLQFQKELKRLAKLLLVCFSKIKFMSQDTLSLTLFMLDHFLQCCETNKYCFELKVRLKILRILYFSKIEKPGKELIKIIGESLEQLYSNYLQYFMDYLCKTEEFGSGKQEEIIWDRLFVTMLRHFHRFQGFQEISKKIMIDMIHFRIDMQTAKVMIKQLEVNNDSNPFEKWKQIFQLLTAAIKIYDQPKPTIMFLSYRSYLKVPLNAGKNFMLQLKLKNSWKIYEQQKFLLMIQDKNRKQELWITTMNEKEGELKILLLRVQNRSIMEQTQQYMSWSQWEPARFLITFSSAEIKVQVGDSAQNSVSVHRFLSSPCYLVIGDCDNTLGTSIKHVFSFSVAAQNVSEANLVRYPLDLSNKSFEFKGLKRKVIPSFVQIFRSLGDLDIFLLIVSHAFKRMKTDPLITNMIRLALTLLQQLVHVKHVQNVSLRRADKQQRLNAILCLCWQCSHQTKNALAVLQLLRVLTIRGIPNPEDELQVLCNFSFWKQFQWQYQRLIILKIKEIFVSYRFHEYYLKPVHKYCKRILMETVIYYREEDLVMANEREHILRTRYEFMILIEEQMSHQIRLKKELDLIYDFLQFLVKVVSLAVSRKSYNGIDSFDLTLAVEMSILARSIGNELQSWTLKDERLYKLIKCIIEVCVLFDFEEQFFVEKKIIVYRGDEGFTQYQERDIKTNLYFLGYKLVSLRPQLLFWMVGLEEKGIPQIACIGWQSEFFDKFQNSLSFSSPLVTGKSSIQKKDDKIMRLKEIFQSLPLKYMSVDQSKKLLKIYLNNQGLFPQIDFRLSAHLWNMIGIKDAIQVMKGQLFANFKEGSEITETSKMQELVCRNTPLFNKKIMSLLIACADLPSQEGLLILNTMKMLYPMSNSEQFYLALYHFMLKNLIEKTRQMMSSPSESDIPLKSCIEMSSSPINHSQISMQDSMVVTRENYTKCIEYYLTQLTAKDITQVKGLTNAQQAIGHLQNCKLQLTIMINHLTNHHNNSMNELKKYYQFLQVHILPLSNYYLQLYKIAPVHLELSISRKKSKHFDFPQFDLKEEVKNMYSAFTDERNENLIKVEKVWIRIEERNKYFWSAFLPKETVYILHEGTGCFNEKYLLKKNNKKEKMQLPRMHRASLMKSASILSEKFEMDENESVSSMFQDAHLYQKQASSCLGSEREIPLKQGRVNKFNVMLITTSKIYQGVLVVLPTKLTFTENEFINQALYKKIYATEFEKRSEDECLRENYKLQEELSHKCLAIAKRYLFHDIAIEIQTKNRSCFFSFLKRDHREACLMLLQKSIKVIKRNQVQEETKLLTQKWETGQISNFCYLMNLNNIAGRSFSDLSQYYIFPWTVTNFAEPINASFFKRKENFRDLSLPVGKLTRAKWQNIKKNYQRTKKDEALGFKPFLYGSFYSNPAIVSNYLIRINPFSSQHFQLQGSQFDLPDRLFYSISDNFKSITMCPSDFKELIPEFYFFPEFLKNRNQYNLGLRQNKDIVNNVILPSWASDEYEFVFRMRKCLESGFVTMSLHCWIDLIFGVYAKKEYAICADNLFLDNLYIDSYEAQSKEKNKDFVQYFKEFGQVPVPIFNGNHRPAQPIHNCLDLLNHQSIKLEECSLHNNTVGRLVQIYFPKKFVVLLFQKQLRLYLQDKFADKDYVSVNGDFEGGSVRSWTMLSENDKKRMILLVHRKKTQQLLGYEIKHNLFSRVSLQGGEVFQFKHKVEHYALYDNMIICSEGKNVYMYKNIEEQIEEEYSTLNTSIFQTVAKSKYLLSVAYQFTQHRSKVIFLGTTERGMVVSIDEQRRVYIVEVHSGVVHIFNYFQIRSTCFQQNICDIILHNQGYIILRTDRQRLLMFTFLGDKIVDQILQFKKKSTSLSTEKMQTMTLWNPEFLQLIMGTNLGNLWKIDPFAIRNCEEVEQMEIWVQKLLINQEGFRKETILKVGTHRIGRHTLTLAYGQNSKLYILKSEKWDDIRKSSQSSKR